MVSDERTLVRARAQVRETARIDRNRTVSRFTELIDYAFAWLEPHEATLTLAKAEGDLRSEINRAERDTLTLRALRKAQAELHGCEALDEVEKAIEALTCEGGI